MSKKSKRGFTLVEMVLVMAIIVIMATISITSIVSYVSDSQKEASYVDERLAAHDAVVEDIDGIIRR